MADHIVTSESMMLSWYKKVIGAFCQPDDEILNANLMCVDESWLPSEKIVPLNIATFVSSNFGAILMALIFDYNNIRQDFIVAVDKEFSLNDVDKTTRKNMRKDMRKGIVSDKHYMELGVTSFSYKTMSSFLDACDKNIKKYDKSKFSKDVDSTIKSMDVKDRVLLGVVLSNFAYLTRAICNNAEFYNQLVNTVNKINTEAFA